MKLVVLPLLFTAVAGVACGVQEIEHTTSLVKPPPSAEVDAAVVPPVTPSNDDGEAPVSAPRDAGVRGGNEAGAPVTRPDASQSPDGPVTGTVGVTIAGHFVPREKALVVLHIGHSNMAGRATGPAELKPLFYDITPQLFVYRDGTFAPAQEPTAPDNQEGQAAGPGMALLHTVQAAAPADAAVISIGRGQSGSFAGYCSNFRKGGLFYDFVMKPAVALKGQVTFVALFTMLGQSEHNATAAQQHAFSDCMSGIAADVRGDLDEPDLPFMVGDYEAGITKADIAPTTPFAQAIIAQIKTIPGKTPRAAIIPTDGVAMEDDHHFNMAGHKLWAERAIKLLVDNGWAPWAMGR